MTDARNVARRTRDSLERWGRQVRIRFRAPRPEPVWLLAWLAAIPLLVYGVDPWLIRILGALHGADGWFGSLWGAERGPVEAVCQFITALFFFVPVLLWMLLAWGWGVWRRDPRLVRFLSPLWRAAVAQSLLTEVLKLLFGRERPAFSIGADGVWRDVWRWFEYGGSFPSGHATFIALLATIGIAYWPRLRKGWIAAVVVVCLARMLILRHHLSDVTAGLGIGWFLGSLMLSAYPPLPAAVLARRRESRRSAPTG